MSSSEEYSLPPSEIEVEFTTSHLNVLDDSDQWNDSELPLLTAISTPLNVSKADVSHSDDNESLSTAHSSISLFGLTEHQLNLRLIDMIEGVPQQPPPDANNDNSDSIFSEFTISSVSFVSNTDLDTASDDSDCEFLFCLYLYMHVTFRCSNSC